MKLSDQEKLAAFSLLIYREDYDFRNSFELSKIIELSKNSNLPVRMEAYRVLDWWGNFSVEQEEILEAFLEALKQENMSSSEALRLLLYLKKYKNPKIIPVLQDLLSSKQENSSFRANLYEVLSFQYNDDVEDIFIAGAFQETDEEVLEIIFFTLSQQKNEKIKDLFLNILESSDNFKAESACEALTNQEGIDIDERLISHICDLDSPIRGEAFHTLKERGSLPLLLKYLKE